MHHGPGRLTTMSTTALDPIDRPVVFLDVDGVVNHDAWSRPRGEEWELIDPACVARVERLCRATGAAVVISSAWREVVGLARTVAALRANGLTVDVVGETPVITRAFYAESPRGDEVRAWLSTRAMVDRWVVLDDNHVDVDPGRFVLTNPAVGLTDADVERAVAILSAPRLDFVDTLLDCRRELAAKGVVVDFDAMMEEIDGARAM